MKERQKEGQPGKTVESFSAGMDWGNSCPSLFLLTREKFIRKLKAIDFVRVIGGIERGLIWARYEKDDICILVETPYMGSDVGITRITTSKKGDLQ